MQISSGQIYRRKLLITEKLMTDFAKISEDVHALHVDANYAKARGFSDRVAYGNILSLMVSALVGVDIGGDVMLISQKTAYRSAFFIGDEIALEAVVTNLSEAVQVAELKMNFTNQSGKLIATGVCQIKTGFENRVTL